VRYSDTPRCPGCGMRAILDPPTAQRLVAATGGALTTFECPEGTGLHVWNPDFEKGRNPGRR
jgi:hypothetical protein